MYFTGDEGCRAVASIEDHWGTRISYRGRNMKLHIGVIYLSSDIVPRQCHYVVTATDWSCVQESVDRRPG
jgi:hypothetical protein